MKHLILLLAGAMPFLSIPATARAAVTVMHGLNDTFAYQSSPELLDYGVTDYIESLSETGLGTASAGNSFAETFAEVREEGGQILFDWTFTHARDGSESSNATSYGFVRFQSTEATQFQISGIYSVNNTSPTLQHVYLRNRTTGESAFESYNYGTASSGSPFVVGAPTATFAHVIGGPSGTLIAGDIYEFYYEFQIDTQYPPDSGDSARGELHLALGSESNVPEPATLTIWGIGALGCALATWRRKPSRV